MNGHMYVMPYCTVFQKFFLQKYPKWISNSLKSFIHLLYLLRREANALLIPTLFLFFNHLLTPIWLLLTILSL